MIHHVFPVFDTTDPETIRRNRVAQMTWKKLSWKDKPVAESDLPRLYREDGKAFYYLKDVFDQGCREVRENEIVAYSNSDIHVRSDACAILAVALQDTNAVYCSRRDFHHRIESPIPDSDYAKGFDYPGKDLFAFRAGWWRAVRDDFPDLILGFEAWDACLQEMIELTNKGSKNSIKNLICHEKHSSRWERSENRYSLPGQKTCLKLAFHWLFAHGVNPGKHGIRLPL